jgi:hypothetical protein
MTVSGIPHLAKCCFNLLMTVFDDENSIAEILCGSPHNKKIKSGRKEL